MQFIYSKIVNFNSLVWLFLTGIVLANGKIDLNDPIHRDIYKRSKAADIKAWLNPDADPCNDFYNFACGKWQKINSANTAKTFSTNKFMELTGRMQRRVDQFMNQPKTGDVIADKLRDFHASCRLVKSRPHDYKLALKNVYKTYGIFSFDERAKYAESSRTEFNWWSIIADIQKTYGKSIILSLDVLGDVKDKNQTMLYIGPPEFFMMEPETDRKITQYLNNIFFVKKDQARAVTNSLLEFEFKLIQGASDIRSGQSLEELLTLYHVNELIAKYKDLFDFERFLQLALNTTHLPQQIYLYDESYLANLIDVIATTDSHIVEDYILWLLLEEYLIDAPQTADWDKWCGEKSKKYFGKFIDNVIYKQYRSMQYEWHVFSLWEEIQASFREALLGVKYHWMSKEVREEAIRKLKNMKLIINSYEGEPFADFYQDLQIDPQNYVANIQNILKRAESLRENKMKKKTDGIEESQVLSFTPVYSSFENTIKIPVPFLQPASIWHPIYPKAIEYATLGFLMAHEMIHGFDDEGRHYDAQGHATNWWDDKSVDEFETRRSCFQSQYHSYIYDDKPLPSSVSQSENIADNAAVKLAFTAYLRWLKKTKSPQTDYASTEVLPNLSYNNWQLYFLSFAQLWCEDVNTAYKTTMAMQDVHAPSVYRVIGALSNFDKFSEVFKCKPGSVMNPSKKCAIY